MWVVIAVPASFENKINIFIFYRVWQNLTSLFYVQVRGEQIEKDQWQQYKRIMDGKVCAKTIIYYRKFIEPR